MKRVVPIQIYVIALACCFVATAAAQEAQIEPGSERPMFTRLKPTLHSPKNQMEAASTAALPTWNGSFSYNNTVYNYNMVGNAPTSATTTTIPTYIIPIKIVLSNGTTYDPAHKLSNSNSVIQNTVASPIFSGIQFFSGTNGSVSMGTTQYIDAFQRANFWGANGTSSHWLLGGPTVLTEVTLNVPKRYGSIGTVFGVRAGLVDINWFDSQLHSLLSSTALTGNGVQPSTFPIFLTYDVYLTQNRQCCIGGYHSSTGSTTAAQSYAHATYVDVVGAFAQDVSALSHEVGEWMDDPLVNNSGNPSPCGGSLENGDPLENNANYGGYEYTGNNGFRYNLQDLVTLPYFGAPTSTSVNGEFSFQHENLTVCQNGA
jgi:hypothetical protein